MKTVAVIVSDEEFENKAGSLVFRMHITRQENVDVCLVPRSTAKQFAFDYAVFMKLTDRFTSPHSLSHCIKALEEDSGFVFSPVKGHDSDGKDLGLISVGNIYPHNIPAHAIRAKDLRIANFIPMSSVMMPRAIVRACNLYETDWAILRAIAKDYSIAYLAEPHVSVLNGQVDILSEKSLDQSFESWRGMGQKNLADIEIMRSMLPVLTSAQERKPIDLCATEIRMNQMRLDNMLSTATPPPNINLVMIVKDEEPVVERCMNSSAYFASGCVAIDTGSTDNTLSQIANFGWDAVAIERADWHDDFAEARNLSLELALNNSHAEWNYLSDADETAHFKLSDILPLLSRADVRAIAMPMIMEDGRTFPKVCLIRNESGWAWKNAYHEELSFCGHPPHAHFVGDPTNPANGPHLEHHNDGARSKAGDKNENAVETLQRMWRETQEPRNLFYLGEAFQNCGRASDAEEAHIKFLSNPGDLPVGFRYVSHLQIARARMALGFTPESVLKDAYELCPSRAEALGELALYHAKRSEWPEAYLYALACAHAPEPIELEFVEPTWRAWKGLDLLIASLIELKRYQPAHEFLKLLLTRGVPPDVLKRLQKLDAELTKNAR